MKKPLLYLLSTMLFILLTSIATAQVTANFAANPLSGNAPLEVQFADLSTGTITSWNWDFGDGTSSTLKNPIHVFNTPNMWQVTLTVSDGINSDFFSMNIDVLNGNPPPDCMNPVIVNTGLQQFNFQPGETWLQFDSSIDGLLEFTTCNQPGADMFNVEIMLGCAQYPQPMPMPTYCSLGSTISYDIVQNNKYFFRVFNSNTVATSLNFEISERIPAPGETCLNAINLQTDNTTNVTVAPDKLTDWFSFTLTEDADVVLTPNGSNDFINGNINANVFFDCSKTNSVMNIMFFSTNITITDLPAGTYYVEWMYTNIPESTNFDINL